MRIFLAAVATLIIALFTQASFAQGPSQTQAQIESEQTPSCFVVSEGLFRGAWVKHRIYVNEEVVYGANDMGSILDALEDLREQGICR